MDVEGAPCANGPKRVTARWIYSLTALLWLSDAIATGTLFDVYLSDLALRQHGKADEFVGILESSRGTSQRPRKDMLKAS